MNNSEQEVVFKQSEYSSNVGRQISFALIAVAWALSYSNGHVNLNFFLGLTIVILVIYFSVDLSQYFFTTIKFRNKQIDYNIAKAMNDKIDYEKLEKTYLVEKAKIITFSFRMFKIKFYLLPIALISLLIHLIKIMVK